MAAFMGMLSSFKASADPWGRKRLYAGGSGNYLVATPNLVGQSNSYSGPVSATLPPGWAYAKKSGVTNTGAAVYPMPELTAGGVESMRHTIAFVAQGNSPLYTNGIADHVVVGARHRGGNWNAPPDNRSDAMLVGGAGIWGVHGGHANIEGIEGGAGGLSNTWPMDPDRYLGLTSVDENLFVLESLQYGSSPVFRFRVYSRTSLLYDSGARYPTGTAFTTAHNAVLLAGVNMDNSYLFRFAIFRMWSFIHPRDTEVPISVVRDTIGY